jgi:hypothetical protein
MLPTQGSDEILLQLSVDVSATKPFIEPQISRPVDVLESTSFFQVAVGGFDAIGDLTDG